MQQPSRWSLLEAGFLEWLSVLASRHTEIARSEELSSVERVTQPHRATAAALIRFLRTAVPPSEGQQLLDVPLTRIQQLIKGAGVSVSDARYFGEAVSFLCAEYKRQCADWLSVQERSSAGFTSELLSQLTLQNVFQVTGKGTDLSEVCVDASPTELLWEMRFQLGKQDPQYELFTLRDRKKRKLDAEQDARGRQQRELRDSHSQRAEQLTNAADRFTKHWKQRRLAITESRQLVAMLALDTSMEAALAVALERVTKTQATMLQDDGIVHLTTNYRKPLSRTVLVCIDGMREFVDKHKQDLTKQKVLLFMDSDSFKPAEEVAGILHWAELAEAAQRHLGPLHLRAWQQSCSEMLEETGKQLLSVFPIPAALEQACKPISTDTRTAVTQCLRVAHSLRQKANAFEEDADAKERYHTLRDAMLRAAMLLDCASAVAAVYEEVRRIVQTSKRLYADITALLAGYTSNPDTLVDAHRGTCDKLVRTETDAIKALELEHTAAIQVSQSLDTVLAALRQCHTVWAARREASGASRAKLVDSPFSSMMMADAVSPADLDLLHSLVQPAKCVDVLEDMGDALQRLQVEDQRTQAFRVQLNSINRVLGTQAEPVAGLTLDQVFAAVEALMHLLWLNEQRVATSASSSALVVE